MTMPESGHPTEQARARELDEEACRRIVQETFLAGVELVQETCSTNDDCLLAIRAGRLPQHPWLYVANHQSQPWPNSTS